jgi:hypothetical protein
MPQGSVSSMTTFTITINGIVNVFGPYVSISLYINDVAIFYGSQNIIMIKRQLQLAIKHLSHWALENGFFFPSA